MLDAAPPEPTLRQQLLQPPNLISWGRVVLLGVCGGLWLGGWPRLTVAIGIVAGLGDYFDGYLARRMGLVSPLGAALDQWSDNIWEGGSLLAGMMIGIFPGWVIYPYFFREFSVQCVRTAARERGWSISSGIWGKVKTNFLHYGVLCGFLGVLDVFPPYVRSMWTMLGWMGVVGGLGFSYVSALGYVRRFLALAAEAEAEAAQAA